MPGVALIVDHVGTMAKPCDRALAAMALLGHVGLVAVHTVHAVLMGGEARSGQGFLAGTADEAV